MQKALMRPTACNKVEFWHGHIKDWQSSGLSQRDYCRVHQVPLSTFTLWRRRLLAADAKRPSVEIVPVREVSRLNVVPVVVWVGGRYRVEIADGFRADTLREVLNALETR